MRRAEAAKTGRFPAVWGVFLLFGSGPASGTSIGSHERAGAGAARETAGTVPAQTLDGSAGPRRAIWADRPGAQLARNPATGDDKSLGAAAARRAHGNGNPCAIEIAAATAAAFTAALSAMRGAARRIQVWRVVPAWMVRPRAAPRANRKAISRHCRCCRRHCRIAPARRSLRRPRSKARASVNSDRALN